MGGVNKFDGGEYRTKRGGYMGYHAYKKYDNEIV